MATLNTAQSPARPITYRVDHEVRLIETWPAGTYRCDARSWTTFRAVDGTQVTVDTAALPMALHLSGVPLHREMTVADIAWACVVGVQAAGGPDMVAALAAADRSMVLFHLDNGTSFWQDPEYRRLWPNRQRYDLCLSLTHWGLVMKVPGGRDIPLGAAVGQFAGEVA